jgi:hypothetical protein
MASWHGHVVEPRAWRRWEVTLWLGILAGLAAWGVRNLLG